MSPDVPRINVRRSARACGVAVSSVAMVLLMGLGTAPVLAQPDLRQMAGVPLPSGELPPGTVSVRVVRQTVTQNLPGVEVTLDANGAMQTGTSDANGRAQFAGIAAGATVSVRATVDGEEVRSQAFTLPSASGVRVLLPFGLAASGAASPAAPAAPSEPAVTGAIALGDETRLVVEIVEGSLEVYYILQFLNGTPQAVDPGPVQFDLPRGAVGAAILEGSSSRASISGTHVTVTAPFPPGPTLVQIGYRMPVRSSSLAFDQVVPASVPQTTLVVRKLPGIDVASPQIANRREVPIEDRTYILATGPALGANDRISLQVDGLPAHAAWPRYVSLSLSGLVVLAGVWLSRSRRDDGADKSRSALERQREHLLGEVVKLHQQRDAGSLDAPTLEAKRAPVVRKLERIYASLDELGSLASLATPPTRR